MSAPDVPRCDPRALPRTADGRPSLRDAAVLREVLRQEGAWVADHLPDRLRPNDAADPRWLADADVRVALERLGARPHERGAVLVWPGELARISASDVPPGVQVRAEGIGHGVLRRGIEPAAFVVDADLGADRAWWDSALGPWTYVSLVRAAVQHRAALERDIEVLEHRETAVGARLVVRVSRAEPCAATALAAAQVGFVALRAPAEQAERTAAQDVARWHHALAGGRLTGTQWSGPESGPRIVRG